MSLLPDSYKTLETVLQDDLGATLQLASLPVPQGGLAADVEVTHLHYNKPQLRSMLVGAAEEYAVWGRGTGKSEGLIAPRTYRNVMAMPRSHGCFVGATYAQLLERTLPPVVKGWEQMGLKRNRDFWIGEKPPKKLGIPEPIVGPLTAEHCIYFKNGSVASMVSQDRPGSSNGKTVHWIAGDEAKFLDKKKLDTELLLTNRGDERHFGGIPEFHSLLFCTDMPTTKSAMWILEMQKMVKPERIALLLSIQQSIYELYEQLIAYPSRRKSILTRIAARQKEWDAIRANTVFFSSASTFDNIHGFGYKNLAKLKRLLPTFIYRTAILNEQPFMAEHAFYPDLDDRHFYDDYNYSFIDSYEFGKGIFDDSRKDADVDPYQLLEIGLDYGASINCISVGQPKGRDYKVINAIYAKHPDRLRDALREFVRYYKHHANKYVRYYFDHTAIGSDGKDDTTYKDIVIDELSRGGWVVEPYWIGHTASFQYRFELWGSCLRGDPRLLNVSFNRTNTEFLRISMQQAEIKEGGRAFEKDKKNERNKDMDQRETTHFSDSCDTLVVGAHKMHKQITSEAFDIIS